VRSDERSGALLHPSSYNSIDALPDAILFDDGEAPFEHGPGGNGILDQRSGRLRVAASVAQEKHGGGSLDAALRINSP